MIEKTHLPARSQLSGLFPVKPFRSPSSNTLITSILYRVQYSTIALYDPFGYLLDTYTLSEPIVQVTPPSASEDQLLLLVLTDTDYLYSLALHLIDTPQVGSGKSQKPSTTKEFRFVGGSDGNGENRVNIREAMAKKLGTTSAPLEGSLQYKQVQV